ncbi:hypothetical protein LX32DRAFT_277889 [Colletotrichum zoysiae]|uniref:Secreted protein n=1 Tax=Colletotrichum zoysiae TaxID=1216348 RepID=A0AAD9LTX1_9PEZI|nr:hypothetical protein LX32DRAFT_277889 [Colletotrichum zoysiae]
MSFGLCADHFRPRSPFRSPLAHLLLRLLISYCLSVVFCAEAALSPLVRTLNNRPSALSWKKHVNISHRDHFRLLPPPPFTPLPYPVREYMAHGTYCSSLTGLTLDATHLGS